MEARHRTAGDGDEHHRKYGVVRCVRMAVFQTIPYFGYLRSESNKGHHNRHGHAQQQETEHRIDTSDQLVDRQQCGNEIIGQNNHHPNIDIPVLRKMRIQQSSRRVDEHHAHQNHQQHHETAHELLDAITQIVSMNFRKAAALFTKGNHARHVIVHRTGKNAAEHDPQEGCGAELGTHDGTADGSHARDVQELDKENAPRLHRDIVHAIGHILRRGLAFRVRTENSLGKLAVYQVT